jgi:hypothetical protein
MTVYRQNGPFLLPPSPPDWRGREIRGPIERAVSVWTDEDRRPARAVGEWADVWARHDAGRRGGEAGAEG